MRNSQQNWMYVIPTLGAAESYGLEIGQLGQARGAQIFECKKYEQMMDIWLSSHGKEFKSDFIAQQLVMQCIEKNIQVLVVLALSPISGYHLTVLRNFGVKLIHWFYEDARVVDYWKDLAKVYHMWCGIQKGAVPSWIQASGGNYKYLPMAASKRFQQACDLRNESTEIVKYDIGFIGVPTLARLEILENLHNLGYSLGLGGHGWDQVKSPLSSCVVFGSWMNPEQSVQLYSSCKILLNLSSMGFSQAEPSFDFEGQISPRVFELALMNKPVISQALDAHQDLLDELGYSVFHNTMELTQCIQSELALLSESFPSQKGPASLGQDFNNRLDQLEAWAREL